MSRRLGVCYVQLHSVDVVGKLGAGRNSDGTEPTWECVLDGQATSSATVERDQNNQVLCSFAGLQEGQYHYLTLQTNSNLFSVDYIQYTPSSETYGYRSRPSFLSIPSQDETFRYDSSWVRPSDSGFATASTVGATFSTSFQGSTLMWYGVIPDGTTGTAQGTYSIDGQPPVTFVVNRPTSSASGDLLNQVFFETPLLTYGDHSLTVNYTANGGLPLTLDRLVIRDQTEYGLSSGYATATAWPSASGISTWPNSGEAIYRGRSMSGGAIAGAVIGSVLGFALLVAALFFFLRRRRSRMAAAPAATPAFVADEKVVGKADTSSIFSRIREKILKEKEELDYAKPPVETEQLPAYKVRNSGVQEAAVDRA
ncbi:hypothetical protein MD484_g7055, partial [Candolleomyces efflorescens]